MAIIMDGNGRWAVAQGRPRTDGHRVGSERVREIVTACRELGVKVLTLYSFSTENWKRSEEEVAGLCPREPEAQRTLGTRYSRDRGTAGSVAGAR